jgi:cytohesin
MLLEAGADARATDEGKRTALHLAASSWRDGTITVLLKARVAANSKGEDGRTPLHLATANGRLSVVQHSCWEVLMRM